MPATVAQTLKAIKATASSSACLLYTSSTAQIAAIQQEIEAYASFRGLQLATLSEV